MAAKKTLGRVGPKSRPCPVCGEGRVMLVLYGMPDPSGFLSAERGEVLLGGCCIDGTEKDFRCDTCSTGFDKMPRVTRAK